MDETLVADSTLSLWMLIGLFLLVLFGVRLIAGLLWYGLRRATPGIRRLADRSADALAGRHLAGAAGHQMPHARPWLAGRLATDGFSGLALTLIVILAGCIAALGGYLAEGVMGQTGIVRLDAQFNTALAPLRDPDLLLAANGLSKLAKSTILVALLVIAVALFGVARRSRYIPGLLVTVVGSETLTSIGKYGVDRHRPDFLTFASASSPSFPSSHSSGSMALYGFLAYAIARQLASPALRFELAYWAGILIASIAFSRLLLSVHFASDVAVGLLIGLFWLLIGIALTEYLNERARRH